MMPISIHALLAESDVVDALELANTMLFLSTLSLRRATRGAVRCYLDNLISIHALLAESDRLATSARHYPMDFYPRSPCGERPQRGQSVSIQENYFYPRSPCGERRWLRCWQLAARDISIHALLAESDGGSGVGNWLRGIFLSTLSLRRATDVIAVMTDAQSISIHALLAESDPKRAENHASSQQFLSTLSLRRATSIKPIFGKINTNFYPRSPCGERLCFDPLKTIIILTFLSTLSLRRATSNLTQKRHPPHNFYPRSPCGERHAPRPCGSTTPIFLSTLSLRRATVLIRDGFLIDDISIHALLAESDRLYAWSAYRAFISIHALLAESDWLTSFPSSPTRISIHALLAESDTHKRAQQPKQPNFYPRSPCGERHFLLFKVLVKSHDFYPRSPCGERQYCSVAWLDYSQISIHALLAESDVARVCEFVWGVSISIHALLAESDNCFKCSFGNPCNFYPRSPCGERRKLCNLLLTTSDISIHALLAESDK